MPSHLPFLRFPLFSMLAAGLLFYATGCGKAGSGRKLLESKSAEEAGATPAAVAKAPPASQEAATPEPTPKLPPIDTTSQVIVLCYHRFEDKPKDPLAIAPAEFEAQLQAIKDQGITVISMDDLLAWRRGEKSIPQKSAIISIDDGYLSGYTVGWPILKKFGYPFTMYIYTDYVKGGKKSGGQSISWEQLAEMRDAGVDIGSHTVSHTGLNARRGKSEEQYLEWLRSEIGESKRLLEQQLGIQVKTIAYPYGLHNETVRRVVQECGYEAGFTVYGQRLAHSANAPMLGRYAIESTKPKVFEQAISFTGPLETGTLAASGQSGLGVSAAAANPAAAIMITQPMEGDTISDPYPEIKANLAALGELDPQSVQMRISGLGLVPATYDPQTKLVSYKVSNKLRDKSYVVIVSGQVGGRRTEVRWTFNFDPNAPPEAAPGSVDTSPPSKPGT